MACLKNQHTNKNNWTCAVGSCIRIYMNDVLENVSKAGLRGGPPYLGKVFGGRERRRQEGMALGRQKGDRQSLQKVQQDVGRCMRPLSRVSIRLCGRCRLPWEVTRTIQGLSDTSHESSISQLQE